MKKLQNAIEAIGPSLEVSPSFSVYTWGTDSILSLVSDSPWLIKELLDLLIKGNLMVGLSGGG